MRGAQCSLPNIPDSVILFLGGYWKHVGNPWISKQLLRKLARIYELPGKSQRLPQVPFI